MRQLETIEIRQGIGVIIQILWIKSRGVASRNERRNAIGLAGKAFKLRAQRHQANGLAAKHANFQEICRFELLKEQMPHHMERVFTKSPLHKIRTVRFEFLGQTLMKIAQALKIKAGGIEQAMGPVARLEAHPRCLASQTPLETRERNLTPMPSDKTGYRHGESLQKRSNKSKIQAPTSNIQRRSKIQCQIGA